jgi:hypothetical protein
MPPVDPGLRPDEGGGPPPIPCEECAAALQNRGDHSVSFLLLDQLTVPIIGCHDHIAAFVSICEVTTTDTPDLIDYPPAGGVRCPSCQLAPYNIEHPVIPVQNGAVGVLACPEHQTEIIDRFQTGLNTQEQLTSSLGTSL